MCHDGVTQHAAVNAVEKNVPRPARCPGHSGPCLGIRILAQDYSTRACIFHHVKLTYWSEARVVPRWGQPH